jgi:hypothetical protein
MAFACFMANSRLIKPCFTILLCLALTACVTSYDGISVKRGKGSGVGNFQTFEVRAVNLPAFLGPIIVSNFSVALAEKGPQPVNETGEALVIIRYEQANKSLIKSGVPQGEARFTARIAVEVRQAGSDDVLWAGYIERDHDIEAGEYMHTGRASIAMLEAFRHMLRSYPAGVVEAGR